MFKRLTAYPTGDIVVQETSGTKIRLKDIYQPTNRYKTKIKVVNEYRRDYSNIPTISSEFSDVYLYNDI